MRCYFDLQGRRKSFLLPKEIEEMRQLLRLSWVHPSTIWGFLGKFLKQEGLFCSYKKFEAKRMWIAMLSGSTLSNQLNVKCCVVIDKKLVLFMNYTSCWPSKSCKINHHLENILYIHFTINRIHFYWEWMLKRYQDSAKLPWCWNVNPFSY